MPAASAMSRTVVARNPRSANRAAAMASNSARRSVTGAKLIRRPRFAPGAGVRHEARCSSDSLRKRRSWVLAADGDDLAGEVGRVVAGEEHDHVGDLPRLGIAAERLTPGELGKQLGTR